MQQSKDPFFKTSRARLQRLPKLQKSLLLGSGLILGAALLWSNNPEINHQRINVPLKLDHILRHEKTSQQFVHASADYDYTVKSGDTLSELFQRAGIDQQTMYRVLESDLNVLALDTLMPGNQVRFYVNKQGQLTQLTLYFSAARQVIFTRESDGSYQFKEINKKGFWQGRTVRGSIHGSFYVSASRMGLSPRQIQQIEDLLKEKLNFSRDLRAGDKFSVLLSDQYIDGDATGQSKVIGVHIENKGKEINAFQYSDGQFYDEHGHSLARAFQRLPLEHMYRISSSFNRHRLHPITGRIAPHNGTDFATPIGTKVIAPGDGVVSLVINHRYAGKYIVIDYGDKYRTRFLHLSKALVRKGQRVTRGQVIALTGNTGRTTGPHLHYEFIINGRPVNPMKAQIPMAEGLNKKQMQHFRMMVRKRKLQMGLV